MPMNEFLWVKIRQTAQLRVRHYGFQNGDTAIAIRNLKN